MSTPAKQSRLTRFDSWLKHVGKSRDGILIVGGALYILGYIVWSINAYIQKLGLLPAFESQYFIAGIVPLLIIVLLYFLIRSGGTTKLRLPARLRIGSLGWWENFLKLIPSIFIVVGVILGQTGLTKHLVGRTSIVIKVLGGIAGILALLMIFSIDLGEDLKKLQPGSTETNWKEKILLTVRTAIIVIAGGAVLVFYVLLVYSKLPPSLGGVRSRCAYLDIQRNGVSKATLKAILPADGATPVATATPAVANSTGSGVTSPAESEITRSDKLEVLFSGSDYVLIRVKGEVYEIKKDVIHAVQSCE